MTIAFMSLIAAQISDRVSARTGLALLLPMLLVGAASVIYWRITERAGVGNVLPYGILQGYSVVILLLLAALFPSRYTRGNDLRDIRRLRRRQAHGDIRSADPGRRRGSPADTRSNISWLGSRA